MFEFGSNEAQIQLKREQFNRDMQTQDELIQDAIEITFKHNHDGAADDLAHAILSALELHETGGIMPAFIKAIWDYGINTYNMPEEYYTMTGVIDALNYATETAAKMKKTGGDGE
jgi:hypothetical protein